MITRFPASSSSSSSIQLLPSSLARLATSSSSKPSKSRANDEREEKEEEEERLLYGDSHFEVGRQRLAARPLWEQYSQKVRARMSNPTHRGTFTEADAAARGCKLVISAPFSEITSLHPRAEACGDLVRMYFLVDQRTGVIRDARFQTFGCATAIAASDVTAELCIGRTLAEAARSVTNLAVERALRDSPGTPAVPPQKMHCSVMSHDVITKAARQAASGRDKCADHRAAGTLDDDKIICECAQVTVGTVRRAIRLNGLTNVAQITQFTKAGGFCKSCVKQGGHEKKDVYILDVLRDELARAKKLRSPAGTAAGDRAGKGAEGGLRGTKVMKMASVQRAVDTYVSPLLSSHGGVATVLDVQESGDGRSHVVLIAYDGSCGSCAAGKTSTLRFIKETLRLEFNDPLLDVRIVN